MKNIAQKLNEMKSRNPKCWGEIDKLARCRVYYKSSQQTARQDARDLGVDVKLILVRIQELILEKGGGVKEARR